MTINIEFQWILCISPNIRCRVRRAAVVEDPDSGIFSKSVVASFFPDLGQKGGIGHRGPRDSRENTPRNIELDNYDFANKILDIPSELLHNLR